MTTHKKYSLRETLLVEDASTSSASLMLTTLTTQVDTHQSYGAGTAKLTLNHPQCQSVLDIEVDGPDEMWVNSLDIVNSAGEPDAACFRKGYGRQMMQLLAQAADQHGVTLSLIAAPPAWLKRQMPELPDKDQLAEFYGEFGFVETQRNIAQVHMSRKPQV